MKKLTTRLLKVACLAMLLLPWQALAQSGNVDFREESIYFLLTTRFFDGDPSNNRPNEWCSYPYAEEIDDPNDVTWRGDFKGLIDKLDYIKDLGFTAIWITPIVQNWSPLDYHGYHAYDFTKVDPRLESPGATFQDLINEVHARDMKIVLDVVTNHAGRYGIKGHSEIKYNTDTSKVWGQDSNGNPLQPNPNWEYDGMTPNPDDGKIWSRANLPKMPAPYNQNLAAYNWPSKEAYVDTSDPEWYHHSGNGFAQGWDDTTNLYNRALAGDTPDLNTGSQVVRDYLVNAYTTFINMGVDAFRWDTIKHMSKEDVLYFLRKFKEANPDLFVFGEVAQKRHELHPIEEINPHWYTWEGAVNNSNPSGMAVIDFYAQATFHNVFEYGQNFSEVMAAARYDHLYADPSTNLLWLDNHDFGPNNDWNRRYGGSPENLAACMNFMFTWRGIPIVYYGTEMQFMQGAYADIHEADDIRRSIDRTGRAYYGDVMDQAPSHRIYQHIKKLNAIRSAVPALQKGSWRWDGNGGGNGVGYVRQHGSSEVAVGLAKDGGAQFNFSGLTPGIYRDAVTGKEVVSNGSLSFYVPAASAGIYVLNGPGMIGANGVGYFEGGIGGPAQPSVSMNPAGGYFEDPVSVSLSATRGTIYYTTDGSTPSAGSTAYSGSFMVENTSTVKAIAIDGSDSSPVVSADFYIGPIEGLKVHFYKPSGWNSANVHYWNTAPTGAMPASSWPGPSMTDEGNGWYSYVFPNVTSTSLLFSDNGGTKTDDLSRASEGWYKDGQWYDSNPDDTTPPPTGSGLTVHFYKPSGWGNANVHYWNVSPVGALPASNWPGPSMTDEGDGWYGYTLENTNSTSLLFSDNGGSKTGDLSRASEGWYKDGQWYDEKPGTTPPPPPPSGDNMTVYFQKPSGWGTATVYFWQENNGNPSSSTTWPGETMTDEGNGWYSYTIPNECSSIIFSNNGGNQTDDLYRCGDGWYENGVWYNENPDPVGPPPVDPDFTVYFKPSGYSNPSIYFWGGDHGLSTTWPGEAMTNEGNGWYSYTFSSGTCSNIIFSNNGANQTADLTRCGMGWYENGTWSSSASRTATSSVLQSKSVKEEVLEGVVAYPNPAQGQASFAFYLEDTREVSLTIYNLLGEVIKVVVNEELEADWHRFDMDASNLTEGMYLYRFTIDGESVTKKLLIRR